MNNNFNFIYEERIMNMKGEKIDDQDLEKVGGGFIQYDPGFLSTMHTKLTEHEAQILNEKLKLKGFRKFQPDRWYSRSNFAERGIWSWSGEGLAETLEHKYGQKFEGRS